MATKVNGIKDPVYIPPSSVSKHAHVKSMEEYRTMYKKSVEQPEEFWTERWEDFKFFWKSKPTGKFFSYNFDVRNGPIFIKWMEGGKTNVCYNVLDRNVNERGLGQKIAYYWEGNEPADTGSITYADLLVKVCKFSNVLRSHGVKKGDRVAIYMPMIVELVVAMLACARIGAVHSIVFGGFSADSVADRMVNSSCEVLVTTDGVWRGKKLVHLKEIADTALEKCAEQGLKVRSCIVVRHLPNVTAASPSESLKVKWNPATDHWWHDEMEKASGSCEPEWMDSEDPLFMLYTSGSTGKPKGVLHTTAGYMLYAATTTKYTFDVKPDDIYWCTADIGWITGHTYVAYGPLALGVTSVICEGVPTYPGPERSWQIVDKYKVSIYYTAPTAIRALMRFGNDILKSSSRDSLRILGTVGEPINPEAWIWYYNAIGNGKCPISDTFWQTETGGHVLTPLPGATPLKPGSATFPFFGVVPSLLDENGKELAGEGEGYLVFKQPWPGMMRTVYGNHERFETTYFKKFYNFYCTGDGARRDADGYLWVTGRVDDMLNVSGHLLSTAQVESALIEHPGVAETAVVSHPHPIKGECLYTFVTTRDGVEFTPKLVGELKIKVRERIGPFAAPEYVQSAPGLPKTRSGKIMRRILRKIAANDRDLGDTSTLAEPGVIDVLFANRPDNVL